MRPPPRERALEALGASLGDVPPLVSVAWNDGARGPVIGREELSPEALALALRRHLAVPWPKGEGTALIPAELRRGATSHGAADAVSVSALHLDHDAGTMTLGAAVERLQALGLEALVFPSPSAPSHGPEARRWRALVILAHPVPAETWRSLGDLGLATLSAALGCAVDGSVAHNPAGLAFVHPRVAARPPEALVHVRGRALDLGALGASAETAGWWSTAVARESRCVCDPDLVVSVVRDGALILGDEDRRGYVPTGCPLEHQHGTSRVGGSLAMLHVATGAWVCLSEHSLAPEGERGRKGTRALLLALAQRRPDLAPRVWGALDSGLLSKVREALSRPPFGEAPRRMVSLAGVPDEMVDAFHAVYRDGRTVLLTPPVGSGKSRSAGLAHAAALRALPRLTGKASSLHVVGDRGAIEAACYALLRAGLEPREHRPVHEFKAPDGDPVCRYNALAERLYTQGVSVRESLCSAVPGVGPCPALTTCRARCAWVVWSLAGDRAVPTLDVPDSPRPWVGVVTSAAVPAAAQDLGHTRPVMVDESDPALAPLVRVLRVGDLALALQRAERLRPTRPHPGTGRSPKQRTAAARNIAVALARGCVELGPLALAGMDPLQRATWALSVLDEALQDLQVRRNVLAWCDPEMVSAAGLTDAALAQWVERPGVQRVSVDERPGRAPINPAGGEALEALAWWLDGADAREMPPDEDAGPGCSVTRWPPVVRALIREGHPALCLDATGDPTLTRAAVGDRGVFEHRPLGVETGADVRRVMVVAGHSARRHLALGYDVQWERAGELLAAACDALGASLGAGVRPSAKGGVVVTARPLAMALWSLSTGAPETEHPSWSKLSERQREALRRSCDAAPPDVHKVLARLGTLGAGADPPVEWVWWGSALSRGSNRFQGRAWMVTLGDHRPNMDAVRDALRAYGPEPTEDDLRREMDSRASRHTEQAHGRLRALQREGETLVMVHVGKVPSLAWFQRTDVVLVTPRTAARWVAPPAVRRGPLGAAVAAPPPEVLEAPHAHPAVRRGPLGAAVAAPPPEVLEAPHAHPAVREALAGWSPAELGAAVGVSSEAVRSWRHGTCTPEGWRIDLLWSVVHADGRGWGRAAIRRCIDARGEPAVRAELGARWRARMPWGALTAWWEGRKGRPGTLPPATERRLLELIPAVAVSLGVDVGRAPRVDAPSVPAVGDGVVSMEDVPMGAVRALDYAPLGTGRYAPPAVPLALVHPARLDIPWPRMGGAMLRAEGAHRAPPPRAGLAVARDSQVRAAA